MRDQPPRNARSPQVGSAEGSKPNSWPGSAMLLVGLRCAVPPYGVPSGPGGPHGFVPARSSSRRTAVAATSSTPATTTTP